VGEGAVIRFADPALLLLGLGVVGVVLVIYLRYERRRRWALDAFAGPLARRLVHAESDGQRRLRWALRITALALLSIAAAGPRWGEEVVKMTAQGADVVLVFDTSQSMDARDVPPSRLDEARREALAILDERPSDRIAVVAFAGDAAVLSPLTLDHSAVRLLIETLSSSTMSTPGSDVGRGLRTALRLLPEGEPGEQAVVLFTDGEDLEGGLGAATGIAQGRGVRVFAVGVGTPGGQTIPLLDASGRQIGTKVDEEGKVVVSRLDARALRDVATKTRGRYFTADHPGGEIGALRGALGAIGRGAREGRLGTRPVERFHLFALLAWLCLVASWLLPERRTLRRAAAKIGEGRPVGDTTRAALALATAGLAATLLGSSFGAEPALAAPHPLVEGNRLYAKGDYRGAARVYQEALKKDPDDPALLTNLGSALYRLGQHGAAAEAFARARSTKPDVQGKAAYGRGNALFRQEKYREALDAYREALEQRPGDRDARFNYELTLRHLRPEDEPEPPPQPPPTPNPNPNAGGGGGGGGGQPQQRPTQPSAGGGQTNAPQSTQGGSSGGQLSRAEAERLLDALEAGERQARGARQRQQGVVERRGKDW
jgi:Ca-activated chloride channel family protein